MPLDKYYQRYADELRAESKTSAEVTSLLKNAAWIVEHPKSREYFDRSVALDTLITAVSAGVSKSPSGESPRKYAVVLTTGSFDPVHNGHVEMMSKSKESIEDAGYDVLAGVMSTGHDDYVRKRKNGPGQNAFARGLATRDFLKSHKDNVTGWLLFDQWESMVAPGAVNFTTVIDWVKTQVGYAVPNEQDQVTVFYVFGEDNASFAHALVEQDRVIPVIVQRKGYDMPSEVSEHVSQGKVLYVEADNGLSSTAIRKANLHNRPFVIRKDARWASTYLSELMGSESYEHRVSVFSKNLIRTFENVFGRNVGIMELDVQEQIESTVEYLSKNYDQETQFISADKYLTGKGISQVQCSRVFVVGTEQRQANYLRVAENEETSANVPYVFIDDDIATGYTVREMRKSFNIIDTVSMLNVMMPYGIKDIVDERDFLIGAENGGLLCESAHGTMRFPYVFPYVNVNTRAKIPVDDVKNFSATIWKLNQGFYKDTGVLVGDVSNNAFMIAAGATAEETVEGYCARMVSLLGEQL